MATCDYRDLKCSVCGGVIKKGDSYTGSFVRPRHGLCYATQGGATQHSGGGRRVPLDSYEAECEEEGVIMRTRSGQPSSF